MNEVAQNQLALDHVSVIARRTDPSTSKAAAAELDADQGKVQQSVRTAYAIILQHGPLSDFQLAELWPLYWHGKWSMSLPAKARHWARQQGLVRFAGHATHNGRKVMTWSVGLDEQYMAARPLERKACPHCGEPLP